MSEKVIVLGGSGMLGSMLVDYLSRDTVLNVTATVRNELLVAKCRNLLPGVNWLVFDADKPNVIQSLGIMERHQWLINAIGITKPLIHDDNAFEIERALRINSLLPHYIARRAQVSGTSVLQIATDCVYSGDKGGHVESDLHDALDVYGKTKSLGEITTPHMHHLRCSIIGLEPKEHKFLLDWFLGQPRDAGVNGFANHCWNGITTLHFAKLCHGIITRKITMPHLHHIIPSDVVGKHELLQYFGRSFQREDVSIKPVEAGVVVDRTLETNNKALNSELWAVAGYSQPPSIAEMIAELASFDYHLAGL